jgi:hypothetical protein
VKPWTEDAIEQIATAQLLNAANTSTGERLALIICDNAVEYMMIAYTEMEKQLVHRVIKPPQWEQTKRAYHNLLAFTVAQEPKLAAHKSDIQSFHNTRNDLYHTGTPLTVKPAHVNKYLDIAKETVEILFGPKLSKEDWDKKVATLNQALAGKAGKTVKAAVMIDAKNGAVQVETAATLTTPQILCLVIDSFNSRFGRAPTNEELERSLSLSHAAHLSGQNLNKRIYDARKSALVQKDRLALTAKGHKLVAKTTIPTPADLP